MVAPLFTSAISSVALGAMLKSVQAVTPFALSKLIDFGAKSIAPIEWPPIPGLIRLYQCGAIGAATFDKMMRGSGMLTNESHRQFSSITDLLLPGAAQGIAGLWSKYVEFTRQTPPLELWRKWFRQGRATPRQWVDACLLHGLSRQPERELLRDDYEQLDVATLRELYLREATGVDAGYLDDKLKGLGWGPDERAYLRWLMEHAMPPVGLMLAAAQRQLFDADVVDRWQMDVQQPQEWSALMGQLGLNWSTFSGGTSIGGADYTSTWGDLTWRQSQGLISLEQAAEYMLRFRGDPTNQATWSNPNVQPMSNLQMQDVRNASGLSWTASGMALALQANRPVPFRQLQTINDSGTVQPAWVLQRIMDLGYPQDVAVVILQGIQYRTDQRNRPWVRSEANRAANELIRLTVSSYGSGSLTASDASLSLANTGLTPDTAANLLAAEDLRQQQAIVQAVIRRTRSDWFAGRTSTAEAATRLANAGLTNTAIGRYLATWQAARGQGHVQIATQKVLRLVREGLLSVNAAYVRLDNLGWAKPDEVLLMAEVAQQVRGDLLKINKAQDLAKTKQVSRMERLRKESEANTARIVRHLRELTPPGKVANWVADGIMSSGEAGNRLTLLGYDQEYIDRILAEAALKKEGGPRTIESKARRLRSDIKSQLSHADLKAALKDKILSESAIQQILELSGETPSAATILIDEWKHVAPATPGPAGQGTTGPPAAKPP